MAAPSASFAEKAGEVTYTKGRVDVTKPGVYRAVPLRRGDTIEVGDIIRTKSYSKAEITYIDGSRVNMAERTRLEVKEFKYQPRQSFRSSLFKSFRGMIRVFASKFEARKGSRFEVESPSAVAGIKGTVWTQTPDFIAVHEGEVNVKSINPNFPEAVTVPANMMVYTRQGAPVSAPTPISDTALKNIIRKTERENGDGGSGDGDGPEGDTPITDTEGPPTESPDGPEGTPLPGEPDLLDPTEPSIPNEPEITDLGRYLDPTGEALNPDGSSKASVGTTMESDDDSTPPEVATVPVTVTAPALLGTLPIDVNVNFPPRP